MTERHKLLNRLRPSQWDPLSNLRVLALMAVLVIGSLASASTALTERGGNVFRGATTVTTAPSGLSPVVIGSNEGSSPSDPLVKVEPGAGKGSADGSGRPRGYTGLFKLAGLILFLVFAWGWWAWGGEMARPAASAKARVN